MGKTTMTLIQKGLLILLLCAASFGLGRYLTPTKVVKEVEEKIVEVVKEVVKQVGKTQTHIIETTYPDGKYVKETFILDEKTVVIEKDKFTEVVKKETETIENSKAQYKIGITTGFNIDNRKQDYGVQLERRLLGNIWGGVYGKTDKDLGVVVKMEF
jgi:hypothetical protein